MWPNLQETADLVTFTEKILNGKLCFFEKCVMWQACPPCQLCKICVVEYVLIQVMWDIFLEVIIFSNYLVGFSKVKTSKIAGNSFLNGWEMYSENLIYFMSLATYLFLYPMKTSENQRFIDIFREYRKRTVAWNGLIH